MLPPSAITITIDVSETRTERSIEEAAEPMKILALELSSRVGQHRLAATGWRSRFWFVSLTIGSIPAFFSRICNRVSSGLDNPERIVVGLGPGSYAGTRIAIATATGLAAASGGALDGCASSLRAIETDGARIRR